MGLDEGVTLHDEAKGGRLTTARRQFGGDLGPQNAAHRKAHKEVQHRPRLLGGHLVHIEAFWGSYGVRDGPLRDFVKHYAFRRRGVERQERADVVADAFALTVVVGRHDDFVGTRRGGPQSPDRLFLRRQFPVLGRPAGVEPHGVQGFF